MESEDGFALSPAREPAPGRTYCLTRQEQMSEWILTGTRDELRSREQRDEDRSGELHGRNR